MLSQTTGLCSDMPQTIFTLVCSLYRGRRNLVTNTGKGLTGDRIQSVAFTGRFGRYPCKILFCGQGCKEEVCGYKEEPQAQTPSGLSAGAELTQSCFHYLEVRSSVSTHGKCIPHRSSVSHGKQGAVNEHTGPDSLLSLYFVHIQSLFTVSISLIAFDTLCQLISTSVNHGRRAEEN